MVFLDSKGKMAIAFLVGLIIIIISIVIIFFVIKPLPEGVVNKVTLCQITNTIKVSNPLTKATLPNACLPTTVNEPLSGSEKEIMEEMAGYMQNCWTMWLRGKKNFGYWAKDRRMICYTFKIKDRDIPVEDFVNYLQTYWAGKKSSKNSYWNYIEEGEGTKNVCFDPELKEGFKKGEIYYIYFRDDVHYGVLAPFNNNNDQILITANKNFWSDVRVNQALAWISPAAYAVGEISGEGQYCFSFVK